MMNDIFLIQFTSNLFCSCTSIYSFIIFLQQFKYYSNLKGKQKVIHVIITIINPLHSSDSLLLVGRALNKLLLNRRESKYYIFTYILHNKLFVLKPAKLYYHVKDLGNMCSLKQLTFLILKKIKHFKEYILYESLYDRSFILPNNPTFYYSLTISML